MPAGNTSLEAPRGAGIRRRLKIVASGMRQCLTAGDAAEMTEEQMEKLFLSLA